VINFLIIMYIRKNKADAVECTRFCHDYDLCGTCEKRGSEVHDPSHVLLKMSVPCDKARLSRVCMEKVVRRCIAESPRYVSNF